jgi:hypothetical protein
MLVKSSSNRLAQLRMGWIVGSGCIGACLPHPRTHTRAQADHLRHVRALDSCVGPEHVQRASDPLSTRSVKFPQFGLQFQFQFQFSVFSFQCSVFSFQFWALFYITCFAASLTASVRRGTACQGVAVGHSHAIAESPTKSSAN